MSDNITLSVVVLSYNNEQYIEDCLTSIIRQGIDSYEVFVVDDCSTDNSAEVINSFIKDKPQFQLICKSENSGGAVSSQIGVEKSRGKYCAIIDSDDIVADGAYKRLIARIEKDGSDFAAGLPVQLVSGYFFSFLSNRKEMHMFAVDHVLKTKEEKSAFFNQVFYWNCLYKTDFLQDNNIHMPSGLLIADRIFLYDAIYKAKKISVDHHIVYYWRRKKNPDKLSIMDNQNEFRWIADRCDSFESQIRVSLENSAFEDNNIMTKKMWESSFARLFYPLYELLKPKILNNTDSHYITCVCDRYRLLLCEYQAFFLNLINTSAVKPMDASLVLHLIEGNYDHILKNALSKSPAVYRQIARNNNEFAIIRAGQEKGRLYLYCQKSSANETYNLLEIKKIIATTRFYRMQTYELDYDAEKDRFDITDLPDSAYNFIAVCKKGTESFMYECRANEKVPLTIRFDNGKRLLYRRKAGGNPFTIMRKNKYTLITTEAGTCIHVNKDRDGERIYFYNTFENIKKPLREVGSSLFLIDVSILGLGENILITETENGVCSLVYIQQFNNSYSQMEKYKSLFDLGRIIIINEKK